MGIGREMVYLAHLYNSIVSLDFFVFIFLCIPSWKKWKVKEIMKYEEMESKVYFFFIIFSLYLNKTN